MADKRRQNQNNQEQQQPPPPGSGFGIEAENQQGDQATNGNRQPQDTDDTKTTRPRMQIWSRMKSAWKNTTIANKLMAIFTGIIAFATVVYMVCAWQQMFITGKQLSQMERDSQSSSDTWQRQLTIMEGQLDQMQKSAESDSTAWQQQLDIMQGQLTHIQEAAHLEQRAWVGLSNASHEPIEPNKPITGKFVFTNTGKTPAIIVTAGNTVCVRPPDFDIKSLAHAKEAKAWMIETRSQGPFAPNATMDIAIRYPRGGGVSDDVVAAIRSKKMCFYVVGRIVYCDIFGVEHETRFCRVADPNSTSMLMHHQYNYMD